MKPFEPKLLLKRWHAWLLRVINNSALILNTKQTHRHKRPSPLTMSTSHTKKVSFLSENDFIIIDNRPCNINNLQPGSSDIEILVAATDIFTNRLMDKFFSKDADVEVPHVEREEYDVLEVSDKCELSIVGKSANGARCDISEG
jgi:hypothetical protein